MQIINGQQTTKKIADNPETDARVLVTIIAPLKGAGKQPDSPAEREMTTSIIAARNWQSRVGYSDLKANDPVQVKLARALREKGYYYERKKKAWTNLDKYAKGLYKVACKKPYGVIKKDKLAAAVLAMQDDPQRPYEGPDIIFRRKYKQVFPDGANNFDYYLALDLLWKRYCYDLAGKGESYAQYHVLRYLGDHIPLTRWNARRCVAILGNEKLHPGLKRATRIIFKLCDRLLKNMQKQSDKPLSFNTVYGKKLGLMNPLDNLFRSQEFGKDRRVFSKSLQRFQADLDEIA